MNDLNTKTEQRARISEIAQRLFKTASEIKKDELLKLEESAESIGKAWSGSWLGYHSRVYYRDFQIPPAGARFSQEWGLMDTYSFKETRGDWNEYTFDTVVSLIYKMAGNPDLKNYDSPVKKAESCFDEAKSELLSMLSIAALNQKEDKYLLDLVKSIKEIKIFNPSDFINFYKPSGQQISRDMPAIQAGFCVPPHTSVIVEVNRIISAFDTCGELGKLAKKVELHVQNLKQYKGMETKMQETTKINNTPLAEDDIKRLTIGQLVKKLTIGAWIWLFVIASGIFFAGFKLGLHFEKIKGLLTK